MGHVPVATWPVQPETLTAVEGSPSDLVTCGGGTGFPAAVLDDPSYPDAPPGPERDALDQTAKVFGGFGIGDNPHWRLAVRTDQGVEYVTKVGDGWVYAFVQFRDGEWGPGGMGDCRPTTAYSDGLGPASWALDPDYPAPTANSTELHVLVGNWHVPEARRRLVVCRPRS